MKYTYKLLLASFFICSATFIYTGCKKSGGMVHAFDIPETITIDNISDPQKSGKIFIEYNVIRQITSVKRTYNNGDAYQLNYIYDDGFRLEKIEKEKENIVTTYTIQYQNDKPVAVVASSPTTEETTYPITEPENYIYLIDDQVMNINMEETLIGLNETKIGFSTDRGIFRDVLFQRAFFLASFHIDLEDYSFFSIREITSLTSNSDTLFYTNQKNPNQLITKYEVQKHNTQEKILEASIQYTPVMIPGE